jgi:hypothetical protein
MDTTMPRSSSKLGPPSEIAVDVDNCCHSQLIAESAVFPKADATLLNTELVTVEPRLPIESATAQMGLRELHI